MVVYLIEWTHQKNKTSLKKKIEKPAAHKAEGKVSQLARHAKALV